MTTPSNEIELGGYLKRRRRRKWLVPIALNMTPMIDVVFLLLVYFVLTTRFGAQGNVLAMETRGTGSTTRDPFALPRKPILIAVDSVSDSTGDYTLTGDHPGLERTSSPGEMLEEMRTEQGIALDQPISIEPSGDTRWEHALAAYTAFQNAGYTNASLSATTK